MANDGRAVALVAAVSTCERCPLAVAGRPSLTQPPSRASLLILGEAPGQTEAEAGLPFVGASGLLDGILAAPTGGQRPLFDGPEEPGASPDVVILPIDGGGLDPARLVIEVKYFDRDFGREEYEQAIAYAATFRCPALLVRPKTAREGRSGVTSIGSIGNIRLFSFAFDLAAPDLDVEEARFTSEVRGLMNRFRSRGRASGGRYDSLAESVWQANLGL